MAGWAMANGGSPSNYIPFEDSEEGAQVLTAFGLRRGVFDAVVEVRLDDFIAKSFQCPPAGDDLR